MQFDPRLVRLDKPLASDRELALPDELALLGEQLGNDAAHLAASYPPGRAPTWPCVGAAAPSRGRAWILAAAASGVLTAASLILILLWRSLPPTGSAGADVVRAIPQLAGTASEGVPQLPNTGTSARSTSSASPMAALTELSAPEIEALLDLWQRDRSQVASVSF